jgi:hypothetical protein
MREFNGPFCTQDYFCFATIGGPLIRRSLADCGKTRFMHKMPLESSKWRRCHNSLRMLKKAVQQGRSERRVEAYTSVR